MKKILLNVVAILMCTTFSMGQTVPAYVPTDSLVAWWPFSGNAIDSSGKGNNGTVMGATLSTDRFGISNHAYYYSSIGCATRIEATVNTSKIKNGITISVWVMKVGDGCVAPRLFEFYCDGGLDPGNSQWGWDNAGFTGFGSVTSSGYVVRSNFSVVPNNVWTHLVYTNDGSFGRFYQDGVLINKVSSIGLPILCTNLAIGRMNHSAWDAFNGTIDDMCIWNRALTPCEISKLYLASNTFFTSKPVDQTVKIGASASFTVKDTLGTSATYQWQENAGTGFVNLTNTSPYSGVTTKTLNINPVAVGMHNNQYRCIRNSGTTCLDTSAAAVLTISNLGITPNQLGNVSIVPNPVLNKLNINAPCSINKLVLFNLIGQVVYTANPESNTASIDMSQYPRHLHP